MFKNGFAFVGTMLLGGAMVLAIPGFSQAQRGGGGHGGGGHFGGGGGYYSGGGARLGGGGGSHYYGGYGGGMYHGAAHYGVPHYGYSGYRPYYGGYGHHRSYYGGLGYYPYYGLYGGYYPYDSTWSPTYDSGSADPYGLPAPGLGYGTTSPPPAVSNQGALEPTAAAVQPTVTAQPSVTAQPEAPAHITVFAPADAELLFNGTPTYLTGRVREFTTPPLAAGKYTYVVQAHWNQDRHDMTETQQIAVQPGAHVQIHFAGEQETL